MNNTDTGQWQRTSPLAAIFYLGKIYEAIAKNLWQTLAPLAALLFAAEGNLFYKVILGGSAFVIITTAAAVVRYWFFRYRVADGSVLIREGVFRKTQLDIKFDRIQAINTQQNVIFKFFGLVTVKFDTAGSSKQEGHLPAIRTAFADALKQRIRRELPTPDNPDAIEGNSAEPPPATRQILRLGGKDMFRIGLSSNRALFLLVLLGPLAEWAGEDVEDTIDDTAIASAIEAGQFSLSSGVGLAMLVVVGFVLFMLFASIFGAFLRFHGFTLVADNDVFRSTGGLLTRHEHSVNFAKIQSILVVQNPVLRVFDRFRLGASQASSGRQGAGKQFVIPLCERAQLRGISREIFGREFADVDLHPGMAGYQPISRRYVRSRVFLAGVIPALVVGGLFLPAVGIYALAFLAWVPIVAGFVWTLYKKYGFCIASDGMLLRRGLFGFRVVAFAHRKVQRVSVTQTLSQKRKGLATLRIYLASGSHKLPYVDFELAKRLRDYLLYKVESSQLAWH